MDKGRWVIISGLFLANIVLCSVLAWQGSQFAIFTLAVTSAFLAVMLGFYGMMVKRTLTDWGRTLTIADAAQQWGMKQNTILEEALKELHEHDEEAAFIHGGRSTEASLEYLRAFNDEDAAYIAHGIKEELNG